MRIESSVTSVSWIPSESVGGLSKAGFELGPAHYDDPLPDVIEDLEALQQKDAFRFANHLKAWVEVEEGRITGYGQEGGGLIGSTTLRFGRRGISVPAVSFPDLRLEPEAGDKKARFTQTAGGRTGVPMPRPVKRKPFFQISAPTAWTTLALTIYADGRSDYELVGASSFPRHWIYDDEGKLAAKSGTIDFKKWAGDAFGEKTPWGGEEESNSLVTQAESALERELSKVIMGGAKPEFRKLNPGDALVEQGDEGAHLFLLLDGVLAVEIDGDPIAEVGPGAILGEKAILEGGRRTATLRARTPVRVAAARGDVVDRRALEELSSERTTG